MNHKFLKLILLSIVPTLLLAGCATGPSLIDLNPVGTEYKGQINFRNKTVPLPEGVWKVIGSGKTSSDKELFEMVLIKVNENKILTDSMIISVETKTTSGRDNGYVKDKRFEKDNYHYKEVINNKAGEAQEGWLIKHTRMSISTKRKALKEAYDYFKNNNYVLPITLVGSFHKFTGKKLKKKYLAVYFYKNPEAEGFKKPYSAEIATSDWHPLHINKYPQKATYVENFIKLSGKYHQKLKEGFGE